VLVLALMAGAVWGYEQLRHSSVFAITKVQVQGGRRVPGSEVESLTALGPEATLLDTDREAVRSRVMANPWIAEATIERDFPHTLVVRVTERKPVAIVTGPDRTVWMVSGDGHWIAPRSKTDTGALVPITEVENVKPGAGAPVGSPEIVNALKVLSGISPKLRSQVVKVVSPSVDKTALITKSGVQIFVGEATELAKKDAVVRKILAQNKGKIVYVNVRTPDRPTWRGIEAQP
jgi:cell division protein FtsQ